MTETDLIVELEKIKYALADSKACSKNAKVRAYFDISDAIEQLRENCQGE